MNRRFFCFCATTLTFSVQVIKAEPATIIVPDNYPTIQGAINAAGLGDVIYVRARTSYEHLVVGKGISLVGENTLSTITDGGGVDTAVYVTASHTSIRNFTVRNSGVERLNSGVRLNGVSNSTVQNNPGQL